MILHTSDFDNNWNLFYITYNKADGYFKWIFHVMLLSRCNKIKICAQKYIA